MKGRGFIKVYNININYKYYCCYFVFACRTMYMQAELKHDTEGWFSVIQAAVCVSFFKCLPYFIDICVKQCY